MPLIYYTFYFQHFYLEGLDKNIENRILFCDVDYLIALNNVYKHYLTKVSNDKMKKLKSEVVAIIKIWVNFVAKIMMKIKR